MLDLPAALAPWAPELEGFNPELLLSVAPLLPRLDLALGPLSHRPVAAQGEPDGLAGLSRRGSYERLLLSEWAVALELPEEFVRRAAMSEHTFLATARRSPAGSRRSVLLFDAGPSQLGPPRIAHLAALVVLARRARVGGASLGWGVLQSEWLMAELGAANVGRLLEARTAREVRAEDLDRWREQLGEPKAEDDLWLIGAPRARGLLMERSRSLLLVREVLQTPVRALELSVVRRGRGESKLCLELPPPAAGVRLLRDPYELAQAPAIPSAVHPGPVASVAFSHCGRRLFIRSAAGALYGFGVSSGPAQEAKRATLLARAGEGLLAVGFAGSSYLLLHKSEGLELRRLSKKGRFEGAPERLPLLADDLLPADPHGLAPCFIAPPGHRQGPLLFVDRRSTLLYADLTEQRFEALVGGVRGCMRRHDGVYVVRGAEQPRRAVLRIHRSPHHLQTLSFDLSGGGTLTTWFVPPGNGRSVQGSGELFVEVEPGRFRLFGGSDSYDVVPTAEQQVVGATRRRKPALMVLEPDRRALWVRMEDRTELFVHTPEPIFLAACSAGSLHTAVVLRSGGVVIYDRWARPIQRSWIPEGEQ